jgi:outer membrane protein assembly factor BamB
MRKRPFQFLLIPLAGIIAIGLLGWWNLNDPVKQFTLSVPGMDNNTTGMVVGAPVKIGEFFTFFKEMEDVPGTNWPRFRGEDYSNINSEAVPLIEKFGSGRPDILWKMNLGEGHAAPAVFKGKGYILDYDETKKEDILRCFSLATGEELWRRGYHVRLKRNHGLSRTIPAVTEKFVVTIGPRCQVMCVDRKSGNLLWGIELEREYKAEIPFWYTGQCPMIDGDTAILAVGGTALLIAVDCNTGKRIWETPNLKGWKMSHASVMPMTLNGKKMYVYAAIGGVCGISASGSDRGKILWENTEFGPNVLAPSPVIMPGGMVFLTAGYGAGGALMKVTESNGVFKAVLLQKYKPSEGLASEQQTPVYLDGYLYGIQPKDAGGHRNQFVACKADDCMKIRMSSGKDERFGLGPYILADGKFFIVNDDGELTIAKATPSSFKVLSKTRIIDGQDSWGPVAITGGYLLMRDSKQMVCLDIKAK